MLTRFASLTYPDLKITDGKGVLAIFRKGIFETDSPKVIDYLRKCKAECTEIKPELVKPEKTEAKHEKAGA